MVQEFIPIAPTRTVMARLYNEGWVDCPGIDFDALTQTPISGLREFIVHQLEQSDGWLWRQDLELATLIFSIPDHEFRPHPQLHLTLKQLETEGIIEIREARRLLPKFRSTAIVRLTTPAVQPRT